MTSAEFVRELLPLVQARLQLAPELEGVFVSLLPDEDADFPAVALLRGRVRSDVARLAHGGPLLESVTVPGIVFTNGGTADEAADLALAIILEIQRQLTETPPQVGDSTLDAMVSRYEWLPAASDRGGYDCSCEFDITYRSDLA